MVRQKVTDERVCVCSGVLAGRNKGWLTPMISKKTFQLAEGVVAGHKLSTLQRFQTDTATQKSISTPDKCQGKK